MERFIVFAVGLIVMVIGGYLIFYNIPIEGDIVGRSGNWNHSDVGGIPVLCIGIVIVYTAFIMKPESKKK